VAGKHRVAGGDAPSIGLIGMTSGDSLLTNALAKFEGAIVPDLVVVGQHHRANLRLSAKR
jgi:hypothetical protein